ncbi:ABC transporter permease [Arthrobacter sp. NPDC058130]|uniref:ABC transporter permease n=1 Tax=Arthrobacter sp. NPDC058130 TaxID=3346353 RepID=UPI0036E66464
MAKIADRTVMLVDGIMHLDRIQRRADTKFSAFVPAAKAPKSHWARPLEKFAEALSALTSRPLRSLMLVCAFLLGAGGLVSATGIAASASVQVSSRLAEGALNRLTLFVPPEATVSERSKLLHRIDAIPHVIGAAEKIPVARTLADVSLPVELDDVDSPSFKGQVLGVSSDYPLLYQAEAVPVGSVTALDSPIDSPVAVIGSEAASQLGYSPYRLGYQIWIQGRLHTVVGVIRDGGEDDTLASSILIPLSSAPSSDNQISIRTEMGYPSAVADALPLAINPASPGDVEVSTVADLRNLSVGVANDLGTLVGLTSAVLLLMAMLSSATAMFLSVQSRAQEIALKRAIGSSKAGIYTSFMIEGALIGLAGGIAGVAAGLASVVAVAQGQSWTASLPPASIAVGILAGLGGGILAAVVPAFAAARIEPAQAIR